MRNRRLMLAAAVLAAAAAGGCDTGPRLQPVTGVVTYRGQPLADAYVTFIPPETGAGEQKLAVAHTDAAGAFTLRTRLPAGNNPEGVAAGNYKVAVSKYVPPPGITPEEYQRRVDKELPVPDRVELLPPDVWDVTKTKLTATVKPDGPNELKFTLP